ncbi:Histone-fold [Artemisia annua]|uniref:Histone-fold n=1 Tax=Artemisia annua TaxID=35608 RepID=A0A2U1L1M2_ARTAN|nr:Histone-fold [Artemisia annua]
METPKSSLTRPCPLNAHDRASDKCQREKRKTVNGDDLLWAMATLGFEDYIEPLKSYLSRYRECSIGVANINCSCTMIYVDIEYSISGVVFIFISWIWFKYTFICEWIKPIGLSVNVIIAKCLFLFITLRSPSSNFEWKYFG